MKLVSRRLWFFLIAAMVLFLVSYFFSAYGETIKFYFAPESDISAEAKEYANLFHASRYHIWYHSFRYIQILLFLLLPVVLSEVYAGAYFDKTDLYIIRRSGLPLYFLRKVMKAVLVTLMCVALPLLFYWMILNLLPTTRQILVEGVSQPEYPVVATIYIADDAVRALASTNPSQYVWYCIGSYVFTGAAFGMFAFSVGNFVRVRIIRYLLPMVLVVVIDFVTGFFLPNFSESIVFDSFNPAVVVSFSYIATFNVLLLVISAVLLFVHYMQRHREG